MRVSGYSVASSGDWLPQPSRYSGLLNASAVCTGFVVPAVFLFLRDNLPTSYVTRQSGRELI